MVQALTNHNHALQPKSDSLPKSKLLKKNGRLLRITRESSGVATKNDKWSSQYVLRNQAIFVV
jgi:hypothetical protein